MTETVSSFTSLVSADMPVVYDCIFENRWTPTRHPEMFPERAHWSKPIIASHSSEYGMWRSGRNATLGVKGVAERGDVTVIRMELEDATDEVLDVKVGTDMFPPGEPSQVIEGILLDSVRSMLSSITMIAPSPDWVSGFHDVSMIDTTTNTWFETVVIDSLPYDAGIDDGTTYTSEDIETNPQVPVFQLTLETVPANGVFLDSLGTDVLPVARWTCGLAMGNTDPPSESPSDSPSIMPSATPSAIPSTSTSPSDLPHPTFPPILVRKEADPSLFRCRGRGRGDEGSGGQGGREDRNEGCLRGGNNPP